MDRNEVRSDWPPEVFRWEDWGDQVDRVEHVGDVPELRAVAFRIVRGPLGLWWKVKMVCQTDQGWVITTRRRFRRSSDAVDFVVAARRAASGHPEG